MGYIFWDLKMYSKDYDSKGLLRKEGVENGVDTKVTLFWHTKTLIAL